MSEGQAARAMTLGERRVRISFNPNQAPHVGELKTMAAAFIDYCDALRELGRKMSGEDCGEFHRLVNLAQDAVETGAMHAVKAATLGLP